MGQVIADPHSIKAIDGRMDCGDERWHVLGKVAGAVSVATYTERDGEPETRGGAYQ